MTTNVDLAYRSSSVAGSQSATFEAAWANSLLTFRDRSLTLELSWPGLNPAMPRGGGRVRADYNHAGNLIVFPSSFPAANCWVYHTYSNGNIIVTALNRHLGQNRTRVELGAWSLHIHPPPDVRREYGKKRSLSHQYHPG